MKERKERKQAIQTKSARKNTCKLESKEKQEEKTIPTPMLNSAWAYPCEVIFPMRPLTHSLAHIGKGMKNMYAN